jgi:predicted peptidase
MRNGAFIFRGNAIHREGIQDMDVKQEARVLSGRFTLEVRAAYLLYLPDGYGEKGTAWPLVVFLHGSGERGTDLELIKRHGPPRLVEDGKRFPFMLLSPQCPENEDWSATVLKALLDRIVETYTVDRSRIYLTGLSRGGKGTWNFAIAYPELFAAIVPVCGWGDPARVSVLKNVPAWVFHGKKDSRIAFERGEIMVRHLEAAGGNVRFTAYPDGEHDCWTETYQDPELYDWMLKQKREAQP